MPDFLKICATGASCSTCRDPSRTAWRDSAAKHYTMPKNWPKCPYGKPMDGDAPIPMKPLDPLDTTDPRNFEGGCAPCAAKRSRN